MLMYATFESFSFSVYIFNEFLRSNICMLVRVFTHPLIYKIFVLIYIIHLYLY